MTFTKSQVLAAAHTAGEEIRAAREKAVAAYDATSWLWRLASAYMGPGRPDYVNRREEETANRLIFKATNATEEKIALTDYEIDVLQPYWKN